MFLELGFVCLALGLMLWAMEIVGVLCAERNGTKMRRDKIADIPHCSME